MSFADNFRQGRDAARAARNGVRAPAARPKGCRGPLRNAAPLDGSAMPSARLR